MRPDPGLRGNQTHAGAKPPSRAECAFGWAVGLNDPRPNHADPRGKRASPTNAGNGESLVESSSSRLLSPCVIAAAHPGNSGRAPHSPLRLLGPAITAFDELVDGALGRVSVAAGKIGAEVAEVTRLVEKAFLVGKDLLVRTRQTQAT
ncbi:hypothetical protein ACP70R_002806 [Stipagrostis hirtigluma subsp. patula]